MIYRCRINGVPILVGERGQFLSTRVYNTAKVGSLQIWVPEGVTPSREDAVAACEQRRDKLGRVSTPLKWSKRPGRSKSRREKVRRALADIARARKCAN